MRVCEGFFTILQIFQERNLERISDTRYYGFRTTYLRKASSLDGRQGAFVLFVLLFCREFKRGFERAIAKVPVPKGQSHSPMRV